MLVSQTLSPIALRNGTRTAFRYLGHNILYKDFWETSNRYSYYLQKELGHGLRVGLWMSNCPHVAYSFLALSNTKNCVVPLNPAALHEENIFKIKHSLISAILCSSDHTKALKELLHQNGLSNVNVIDMEAKRCSEYDPSYTPPANHVPTDKDEVLLLYTPGTTGKYKGCLFNHTAISAVMTAVKNAYKASLTDVFYTQGHFSNPFHFIHYLMAPLAAGATVYISDQVEFKEVVPALTESRVTRWSPNPATLAELLKFSETEKIPIPTVKFFSFAPGTVLSKEAWAAIAKMASKPGVIATYGQVENLGTVAMGTPEVLANPTKPGFVGPPLVGVKVRVVDDNNDEIDKKKPQNGQLLTMGPGIMAKYLELPEEQKLALRGTWLFTGDIVEIDKDGNISFRERKSDVVVLQDGRKVFPKEVEPIVRAIPQVEDVAYIGVRDRLKKPLPAIVIVRKPQAALNEKQVADYIAQKVSIEKRPAMVLFIDAMPRTVSGAINRAKLRSQYDGV